MQTHEGLLAWQGQAGLGLEMNSIFFSHLRQDSPHTFQKFFQLPFGS